MSHPSGPPCVGVLAIQGDFERHMDSLSRLGAASREIRTSEELEAVDRLIIPGGESTTVALLMQRFGLASSLKGRIESGMPVWGTCMGMILLSKSVEGRPDQWTLGALDIMVRRNAFGAQVHSFETKLEVRGVGPDIEAVFIRAPIVTQLGSGVEELATFNGQTVAVCQGRVLGTSFHPELTSDLRLHEAFLKL